MQERLHHGFLALDDALKRTGTSQMEDGFAPLAESLMWVVILNDTFWEDNQPAYREKREADDDGRTIEGLRYARHRLVHDIRVYGLHGVLDYGGDLNPNHFKHQSFDLGASRWAWRDICKLAPVTKEKWKHGEEIYKEFLQGKEVGPTLQAATDFLRRYRTGWVPSQEEV